MRQGRDAAKMVCINEQEAAPGGVNCTVRLILRPGVPEDEGCPGACLRSLWVSKNKDVGEAPRNSVWGLRAP